MTIKKSSLLHDIVNSPSDLIEDQLILFDAQTHTKKKDNKEKRKHPVQVP